MLGFGIAALVADLPGDRAPGSQRVRVFVAEQPLLGRENLAADLFSFLGPALAANREGECGPGRHCAGIVGSEDALLVGQYLSVEPFGFCVAPVADDLREFESGVQSVRMVLSQKPFLISEYFPEHVLRVRIPAMAFESCR
jgi:hypothetical protein